MQAFGLHSHIRANRWRSALLLIGLFLLVYLILFALFLGLYGSLGGPSLAAVAREALDSTLRAAPLATVITLAWILIGRAINHRLIGRLSGAQGITRRDHPELWDLLENLCISRGLPMPRLAIIEDPALNAFASGMSEQQYTITVTRGLLDALDRRELEAVLAHELTHIRNGDVQLMVTAVLIAGVISFAGEIIFRMVARGSGLLGRSQGERKGGPVIAAIALALVILALAWLLAGVLRFALSRRREYLADAGAVELTKDPDAMIAALRRIAGRAELERVPSSIMEMCIENERNGIADIFATHPRIEDRIRALEAYAGGRERPAAFA